MVLENSNVSKFESVVEWYKKMITEDVYESICECKLQCALVVFLYCLGHTLIQRRVQICTTYNLLVGLMTTTK